MMYSPEGNRSTADVLPRRQQVAETMWFMLVLSRFCPA